MTDTPEIPIPEGVQSLLLFGGSFDPPHRAHIELPVLVRNSAEIEWIMYVPSARSPLKPTSHIADDEDRLAMISRAVGSVRCASVSDIELRRGGVSYTIDTVRSVRKAMRNRGSIRLLIGVDQALSFHRWREAKTLLRLAEPIVMLRGGGPDLDEFAQRMSSLWSADEAARWASRVVETPQVDCCSSRLRAALREQGADARELESLLPETVLAYIRQKRLYTT